MTRRRPSPPAARFLPLVAILLAAALAPPRAAAQEELPGIFSDIIEVSVVNVEVVVTDKDGNRVQGLSSADFRLKVDGREVPIDYFSEIFGGRVLDAAGGGGKGPAGLPGLAPGTPVGTSYLVFIDDFFSLPRDRNLVLKHLMDQLPLLGPEDRMALVAFDGRKLDMLSTWSGSLPALERAFRGALFRPALGVQRVAEYENLRSVVGSMSQRLFRVEDKELAQGTLTNNERAFGELRRHQVENVVRAAMATLRSFAQPPGRKVMLLLAGSWPFDPFFLASLEPGRPIFEPGAGTVGAELFQQLADTANVLGYTLYPVDVPGLLETPGVSADQSLPDDLLRLLEERTIVTLDAQAESRNPGEGRGISWTTSAEGEKQSTLRYLAGETGGQALLSSTREDALEKVVRDTRSFYWLGFTPERQGDDSRHAIEVEVRRPGLTVRSRAGYLHASRQSEVTMMTESALLFGNPPSSKRLPVALGAPRKSLASMEVPLTLMIPMDSVTMVKGRKGGFEGRVELRVAALDDHGRRSEIPVISIPITGDVEPEPGSVARYQTTLKLRKDSQQVVVSVFDAITGEILSSSLDIHP